MRARQPQTPEQLEDRRKWGHHYGYPSCCVDAFVADFNSGEAKKRLVNKCGFVPCAEHYHQIVTGKITIDSLIDYTKRKDLVPYPGRQTLKLNRLNIKIMEPDKVWKLNTRISQGYEDLVMPVRLEAASNAVKHQQEGGAFTIDGEPIKNRLKIILSICKHYAVKEDVLMTYMMPQDENQFAAIQPTPEFIRLTVADEAGEPMVRVIRIDEITTFCPYVSEKYATVLHTKFEPRGYLVVEGVDYIAGKLGSL